MAKFLFSAFADEASADILEQIAACKANGIDYIELRNVNGKNISNFTVEEAKELKKLLDDNGIKVSSIGSHYGKIEITDDFEPHFEAFKQTVEVAKVLETKYIRMFSFFFTKGQKIEDYKDEVYRRLDAMVDYSNEHGILCCHENEKGIYGDITERCVELAEYYGERMGCIFDPSNYIQCGCDTLEGFKLLKDKITYMHIKDCIAAIDTVVPAGEGDGHLEEILRMLDENEKVYFLSVEPHLRVFEGLENLEPDDATANAMNKKFVYPDNETSFAAACTAIHNIVENKVQPVRFGIIGVGNMGNSHITMHLKGEHKELRITAIADINAERLEAAAKKLPGVKAYNSAEELLDSGEVDAVIIATPHYDHSPIAQYAFSKGVHVLTEKPAGVYAKQVREMNEAAAKTDLVFGIMYNQRTNCLYRKMREIIQSGELGEIKRTSWIITDWYRTQAYYNSGGWRATWAGEGGGVLLNQCPHNLDLWQWICGLPVKVQAFCHEGKWHDIEVEDDVTIYVEYENGATGTFITTTGDCPGTNRFEVTLDGGKLVCENNKLMLYKLEGLTSEHCANATEGFGWIEGEWTEVETDGRNKQHSEVTNKFAAAILRGEPLVANGEEGIRGLSISNAAHLSSWLGRPVDLPVDEDVYFAELQKKIAAGKAEKDNVNESVQGDMSSTF
ncbi:MAG: Gfo/Idh/MocA family oxidoreductase [Clostridia bacterium]|nr:Gfo/Idh/MocA family oxidoreductase [Clostridia bacterium]